MVMAARGEGVEANKWPQIYWFWRGCNGEKVEGELEQLKREDDN